MGLAWERGYRRAKRVMQSGDEIKAGTQGGVVRDEVRRESLSRIPSDCKRACAEESRRYSKGIEEGGAFADASKKGK